MNILISVLLGLLIGAAPAAAEVEQCRFTQAKAERQACYTRQEAALAAKPEPSSDTTIESLQQMRQEDDAVYKSLRSICRGC